MTSHYQQRTTQAEMFRNIAGLIRYWPVATVRALRRLPPSEFRSFILAYREAAVGHSGTSHIRLRDQEFSFGIRHGTSDFAAFCQVLLAEEYRYVPMLTDVRTIIDAGANVGYSARYFLRRFPDSRVIALEPDAGNLAAAESNLSPYSTRSALVHGALWPRCGRVGVAPGVFRDGREWSVTVSDVVAPTTSSVEAISMDELFKRFDLSRIDILKIDIEGAEFELFSGNTDFMANVRCCAIELHDERAADLFRAVCTRENFEWTVHGETTIAMRKGERSK